MGCDLSEVDLFNVKFFCDKVIGLMKYREELTGYLRDKMKKLAPNTSALIGETVGARLISHAGSLSNLAKYPASTIQILGAEKALFRRGHRARLWWQPFGTRGKARRRSHRRSWRQC